MTKVYSKIVHDFGLATCCKTTMAMELTENKDFPFRIGDVIECDTCNNLMELGSLGWNWKDAENNNEQKEEK